MRKGKEKEKKKERKKARRGKQVRLALALGSLRVLVGGLSSNLLGLGLSLLDAWDTLGEIVGDGLGGPLENLAELLRALSLDEAGHADADNVEEGLDIEQVGGQDHVDLGVVIEAVAEGVVPLVELGELPLLVVGGGLLSDLVPLNRFQKKKKRKQNSSKQEKKRREEERERNGGGHKLNQVCIKNEKKKENLLLGVLHPLNNLLQGGHLDLDGDLSGHITQV